MFLSVFEVGFVDIGEVTITNNLCPVCGAELIKQDNLYFCSRNPGEHKFIRGEDGRFWVYNGDEVLDTSSHKRYGFEGDVNKDDNFSMYVNLGIMFILLLLANFIVYYKGLSYTFYWLYDLFFVGYMISWTYYYFGEKELLRRKGKSIMVPVFINSIIILASFMFVDNVAVKTLVYFVVFAVFIVEANSDYEVDYWFGVLFAGMLVALLYITGNIESLFNPVVGVVFVMLIGGLISSFENDKGMSMIMVSMTIVMLLFFNMISGAYQGAISHAGEKIDAYKENVKEDQLTHKISEEYGTRESEPYLKKFFERFKKMLNPFSDSGSYYDLGGVSKVDSSSHSSILGLLSLQKIDISPNPGIAGKNSVVTLNVKSYENKYEDDEGHIIFSPFVTGVYLDEKGQALGAKTTVDNKEYGVSSIYSKGLALNNGEYTSLFYLKNPECKKGEYDLKAFALYRSRLKVSTINLKVVDSSTYADLASHNKLNVKAVKSTDTGKHPIGFEIKTSHNPVIKDQNVVVMISVENKDNGNAIIDFASLKLLVPKSFSVQSNCDFKEVSSISGGEYNEPYKVYSLKEEKIKDYGSNCIEEKGNKFTFMCEFKFEGDVNDLISKTLFSSLDYVYVLNDFVSKSVKTQDFGSVRSCDKYPIDTEDMKSEKIFEGLFNDNKYIVKELSDVLLGKCENKGTKISSIGNDYILEATCNVSSVSKMKEIINEVSKVCYNYEKDIITDKIKCVDIDFDVGSCDGGDFDYKDILKGASSFRGVVKDIVEGFSVKDMNVQLSGDKSFEKGYNYNVKVDYITKCFNKYISIDLEKRGKNNACNKK